MNFNFLKWWFGKKVMGRRGKSRFQDSAVKRESKRKEVEGKNGTKYIKKETCT